MRFIGSVIGASEGEGIDESSWSGECELVIAKANIDHDRKVQCFFF